MFFNWVYNIKLFGLCTNNKKMTPKMLKIPFVMFFVGFYEAKKPMKPN